MATQVSGFFTHRAGQGWSPTLPSNLGENLVELERRYGPRDRSWTCLGIIYGGRLSGLWYPAPTEAKQVLIRLGENSRNNYPMSKALMAHEAVHLLAPTGGRSAPMLEEGLATNYCAEIAAREVYEISEADVPYQYAKARTAEFLAAFPDAIREIRKTEPRFGQFTPALILKTCPNIDERLAIDLCEPFQQVEARLGVVTRD
jgi:hypothetical protein